MNLKRTGCLPRWPAGARSLESNNVEVGCRSWVGMTCSWILQHRATPCNTMALHGRDRIIHLQSKPACRFWYDLSRRNDVCSCCSGTTHPMRYLTDATLQIIPRSNMRDPSTRTWFNHITLFPHCFHHNAIPHPRLLAVWSPMSPSLGSLSALTNNNLQPWGSSTHSSLQRLV